MMSDQEKQAIKRELAELAEEYVLGLPDKLQEIRELYNSILLSNNAEDMLDDLYILAHRITGTSGTFGFKRLSACSRSFENFLSDIQSRGFDVENSIEMEGLQVSIDALAVAILATQQESKELAERVDG